MHLNSEILEISFNEIIQFNPQVKTEQRYFVKNIFMKLQGSKATWSKPYQGPGQH